MLKRVLSIILVGVLTFSMGMCIFASESVGEIYDGVSPYEPSDIQTRSVKKSTKVWDIIEDGQYHFSGVSHYERLYTNYKFTGKDEYTVIVTNSSENDLEVVVRKSFWTKYATFTVVPGETSSVDVSGMDSDTEFYIQFDGSPQDFSGYIR